MKKRMHTTTKSITLLTINHFTTITFIHSNISVKSIEANHSSILYIIELYMMNEEKENTGEKKTVHCTCRKECAKKDRPMKIILE